MSLVDIGVNLTNKSFRSDLPEVIERASAASVTQMVITGTSEAESARASEMARSLTAAHGPRFFSTAGVHPHDAKSCNDGTLERLTALASQAEVVALGECGLDYNRDFSPRPIQDRWFEAQVELAVALQMPLFLHERDAHERFIEILGRHRARLKAAVVHCFTGSKEALLAYLKMDLHIGITGWICDERRGLHLRELLPLIPLDRLMLETDAPYLTPRTMPKAQRKRSGRNEPSFLPYVLQEAARALQKTEEEVAEATSQTARSFFDLPVP